MFPSCRFRNVTEDGRVVCQKIVQGDNEVSAGMCQRCPAMACGCSDLRFTLRKNSSSPILVRWGNGRTEVWNNEPSQVAFVRAACAARIVPIVSPQDCAGCRICTDSASRPMATVDRGGHQRRQLANGEKIIAFREAAAAVG